MSVVSILSVLTGMVILILTILDAFVMVFVVGAGAGVVSSRFVGKAWRVALSLHDPNSALSHAALRCFGPLVILVLLAVWLLGLIIGWTLVFVPEAFSAPRPSHYSDRLVFATNAVVGRGGNNPELVVSTDLWEMVHALAGLTGIALLSLGLAYVLPVLSAVAHRRSIAGMVHSLGDTVDDIRRLAGRLEQGGYLELHLIAITPAIVAAAEQHRSYPVLHYFHSKKLETALAPAIAKLCLLVHDDFPQATKVDDSVIIPLARAVRQLLGAVYEMGLDNFASGYLDAARKPSDPASLDVDGDQSDGLPEVEWLEAYVVFDGWSWQTVKQGDSEFLKE